MKKHLSSKTAKLLRTAKIRALYKTLKKIPNVKRYTSISWKLFKDLKKHQN